MHRLFLMLLLCLLASCAPEGGDPAAAVERYLQAKVSADRAALQGLLCAEMESALDREARTFASVSNVRIEDMVCTRNAGADTVTCTGEIAAEYGADTTSFALTTYRVVQEDGEWKWCGEAE